MELSDKLQETHERLAELQREQQRIELQRRRYEELSRKQQEVEEGRKEMAEKLRRAQVVLERDEQLIKRDLETIQQTRQTFGSTLTTIEEIVPEEWDQENLEAALTEALSRIEYARGIFQQNSLKIGVMRGGNENPTQLDPSIGGEEVVYETEADFMTLVRRGFATHLPLLLLGILGLVLFWVKR